MGQHFRSLLTHMKRYLQKALKSQEMNLGQECQDGCGVTGDVTILHPLLPWSGIKNKINGVHLIRTILCIVFDNVFTSLFLSRYCNISLPLCTHTLIFCLPEKDTHRYAYVLTVKEVSLTSLTRFYHNLPCFSIIISCCTTM